jgi:hypothetical protein
MLGIWHFFGTQVDGSGFVKTLPNATVTVKRESDGALAEIESDIDAGSPGLDNPFTSGADGEIAFYADTSERYRIDIDDGSAILTLRHQAVSAALKTGALGIPENFELAHAVAANALIVSVKTEAGTDPSAADPVSILMPDGDGAVNRRSITSAISLTISSGSLLGHNDGLLQYIYWYLIDNAGTVELAASSKFFGNHGIVTTTAEGGAGAADSGTVMYSDSARTSVPFVCIGYTEDTQTTAGTWGTAPSAVHLAPFTHPVISFSAHKNGTDQTGVVTSTTTLVTFSTEVYDNGELFDAVTNFRWVPPPGTIHLSGLARFTVAADGSVFSINIFKNGVIFSSEGRHAATTANITIAGTLFDECNGTDFYDFRVFQNTGTDKIISGTANQTRFFGSWSPGRS